MASAKTCEVELISVALGIKFFSAKKQLSNGPLVTNAMQSTQRMEKSMRLKFCPLMNRMRHVLCNMLVTVIKRNSNFQPSYP